MTGWISSPGIPNPLSQLSIMSLADFGYSVNPAMADPFFRQTASKRGRKRNRRSRRGLHSGIGELKIPAFSEAESFPKLGRERGHHRQKLLFAQRFNRTLDFVHDLDDDNIEYEKPLLDV